MDVYACECKWGYFKIFLENSISRIQYSILTEFVAKKKTVEIHDTDFPFIFKKILYVCVCVCVHNEYNKEKYLSA